MAQATTTAAPAAEAKVNTFLAQVYLLMFVGLGVTGIVSLWVSENTQLESVMVSNPWLGWGLLIVQVILVHAISTRVMNIAPGGAVLLFLLYAALTGVVFSGIFLLYGRDQIYTVFFITSATFLVSGLIGLVIKKDMSGAGHFLFMLLTGWFLAWLASWLFSLLTGQALTNVNWALNYIGIAIFVGLTAWDNQQLKKVGQQIGSHPARGGLVVIGALKLYLDYINLFLLLLRASSR
jgi:FtsH-binding integral membrane protein